jgi:hypothetical protein
MRCAAQQMIGSKCRNGSSSTISAHPLDVGSFLDSDRIRGIPQSAFSAFE